MIARAESEQANRARATSSVQRRAQGAIAAADHDEINVAAMRADGGSDIARSFQLRLHEVEPRGPQHLEPGADILAPAPAMGIDDEQRPLGSH